MGKGIVRNPAAVIIFSFITCGIYSLYWIFKFADELKIYLDSAEINPGVDLLLSILCFPYTIYWSYKYGKLISQAQQNAGLMPEDNSILYLVLSIFGLFFVNMAIMQSSMNKVWQQQ